MRDNYPYGYPQTYLMPNINSCEMLAGMTSGMRVYMPIAQGHCAERGQRICADHAAFHQ